MTTLADLVHATRQHMLGGLREQKNKLATGATTTSLSDNELTFTYSLGPIQAGSVITVGLERMYVWAVEDGTNEATVERGWEGTTVAAHTIGDIVAVNSRCDDVAVLRAINNELTALSSPTHGLFRVRSVEVTFTGGTYGYNLTSVTDIIGAPLSVLARDTSGGIWDPVKPGDYLYSASADTDDFASGRSLMFYDTYTSGQPIRVIYRAPFTALAALTDDVQTVSFLPATANDIPPMGAALQLAMGRAMQRSDLNAQGSTRRAEEVSEQDTLTAPAGLRARYTERIAQEAARLAADWPAMT